jgi:hypothetical protein
MMRFQPLELLERPGDELGNLLTLGSANRSYARVTRFAAVTSNWDNYSLKKKANIIRYGICKVMNTPMQDMHSVLSIAKRLFMLYGAAPDYLTTSRELISKANFPLVRVVDQATRKVEFLSILQVATKVCLYHKYKTAKEAAELAIDDVLSFFPESMRDHIIFGYFIAAQRCGQQASYKEGDEPRTAVRQSRQPLLLTNGPLRQAKSAFRPWLHVDLPFSQQMQPSAPPLTPPVCAAVATPTSAEPKAAMACSNCFRLIWCGWFCR